MGFRIKTGCLAIVLLGISFGCSGESGVKSYDELSKDVEYVLELIAKRQLSPEEISRATREYHLLFDNHCDEACINAVQENKNRVLPMRTKPGQPADLLARQYYSRVLYFSPTQAGSFIQQLSNETDPVVVVDRKIKRVMTKADVLAVMNIYHFVKHGGRPVNRSFPDAQVKQEITRRQNAYTKGWRLPFRTGLAAELWTGIYQNWDHLNADQQAQVRRYFSDKDGAATMTVATYGKILGMEGQLAENWHRAFTEQHQFDRLAALQYMTLMGSVARSVSIGEAYWRW